MNRRRRFVVGIFLVASGCARDPRDELETQPADAALTQAEVTPGVAPMQATQAAPPAVPVTGPNIVVAQIGTRLDAAGMLAAPAAEMPVAAPVHGMALFRGVQGAAGEVELRVFDARDHQVWAQSRQFVAQGDTRVMFTAKPGGATWPSGQYRALYLCSGRPCWEVKFVLR
jgi:hypothetical protein